MGPTVRAAGVANTSPPGYLPQYLSVALHALAYPVYT